MVPLEVWLLGGAVLAFGASLWLVAQRDRQGTQPFEALADANGWDCRRAAPEGLTPRLAEIAHLAPLEESRLYLAGPATAGPFQMIRVAGSGNKGGRSGDWTLLHLRTTGSCRGFWVTPADRFRSMRGGAARIESAFARRFQVGCLDAEDYEIVDDELRSLLLRPQVPVRVGWVDEDLVIAFPLGVSSPRAVDTLLSYGNALARQLTRPRQQLVAASAEAADPDAGRRGVVV